MAEGTFVGARLCPDSLDILQNLQNGILAKYPEQFSNNKLVTRPKLHITISYSTVTIPFPENIELPCKIEAKVSRIANIGNALALILYAPQLSQQYTFCRMLGATNKFGGYIPHCSLFYENTADSYKLKFDNLPEKLWVESFYSEPLN